MHAISALGHYRQEDQDFMAFLCYLDNPKPVCAARDFIKNKNKTKDTHIIRLKDAQD